MIDVTKIDEEIKYLDFEPKKAFGGGWWLAALLVAPYIAALVALVVEAVLRAKG